MKKIVYLSLFVYLTSISCTENSINPMEEENQKENPIVWNAPPTNNKGFAVITSLPDSLLVCEDLRVLGAADERVAWVSDWCYNFLLKTENGGTSWIVQNPPVQKGQAIYCIEVYDSLMLWVGTTGGQILKSEDGGYSWTEQYKANFTNYIEFFDKNTGIALCDAPAGVGNLILLHTTDGGNTWVNTNNSLTYGTTHYAVSFTDPDNGWVKTEPSNKFVHYTTNGGENWDTVYIDSNEDILTLVSPKVGDCIIAGLTKNFYVSDFGATIEEIQTPTFGSLGRMKNARNASGIVYAVDGKTPLFSNDFGKNWNKIFTGFSVSWWDDVSAPKKNVVWFAGNPNKITYTVKADSIFGF